MSHLLKFLRIIFFDYTFLHKKNGVYILMFHRVNDLEEIFYKGMPTQTFKKLIDYVNKYFIIIHFEELENQLLNIKRKKPLMIITFDDGMKDIETDVFPYLKNNKIKFTVNIDTLILETKKPQYFVQVYDILNNTKKLSNYFDEKYMQDEINIENRYSLEIERQFTELLSKMTNEQKDDFITRMIEKLNFDTLKFSNVLSKKWIVENKANGIVRFGSHSHSHPILSQINLEELDFELSHSKAILESLIDRKIEIFAYPNGASTIEIDEEIYRKGYKYVLKTEDKINYATNIKGSDSFYRINQYHQNLEFAILQTLGILNLLRKIKGIGN